MTIYTQLIVTLFFLLMTGYLLYTYVNKKAVNERFIYFTFIYFLYTFFIFYSEKNGEFPTIKVYILIYFAIIVITSSPIGFLCWMLYIFIYPNGLPYNNLVLVFIFYLSSILQWFVVVPFIIKKVRGKS